MTTTRMTDELLDITERASKITDRLIDQGTTYWARVYRNPALRGRKFQAAFNKNPAAGRAVIRGNIMDDVVKDLAEKAGLPFLRSTPRGARGADFYSRFLDAAWDVTTPGSWASHFRKYAEEQASLLPLFY